MIYIILFILCLSIITYVLRHKIIIFLTHPNINITEENLDKLKAKNAVLEEKLKLAQDIKAEVDKSKNIRRSINTMFNNKK